MLGDLVDGVQQISISGSGVVPVEAQVFIDAAIEPCFSDPTACDKTENFTLFDEGNPVPVGFGCADGMDNDADGLTDGEDPDCNGIQGWSLSVEVGACFNVASATTSGTIAALSFAGGIRDFSSFEKTEVVDPLRNDGRMGATSAVVLALTSPIIADQVGPSLVLLVSGMVDLDSAEGCPLTIIPPGTEGLRGAGEPVKTAITVAGETENPVVTNLLIGGGAPPPVEDCATEGDEDGNGLADCDDPACAEDPLCVVVPEDCATPGDEDGNGLADCEDPACADDPLCVVVPEDCATPGDEDGNGLADCEDPACADDPACILVPEDCATPGDEDGNGLSDCEDPACAAEPACQPEPGDSATGLRINVPSGEPSDGNPPVEDGISGNGTLDWDIVVAAGGGSVDVQVNMMLEAQIEPCVSDPAACDGTENFTTKDDAGIPTGYGCADMIDNDEDGLTDAEDPDCRGVQGWSASVKTGDCFNIASATTAGTIAGLVIAGGIRDFSSFEKTEVVDPANNAGQQGSTTAVVLSLTQPVIAPQTSDSLILIIQGAIDASGLTEAGQSTDPCSIEIVPPGVEGLRGAGEPVKTAATVAGETDNPRILNANITLSTGDAPPPEVSILRGDSNDDAKIDIADAVYIIAALFRDGPAISCPDAGDANDDGNLDSSDATFVIAYRFMNGPSPAPNGCEVDATEDALTCDADTSGCGS